MSGWRAGARLRRQATLAGHVNVVTSLAFTRDGRRLASGSDEGEIRSWTSSEKVDLHTLRGSEWIDALAFSRDGRLLASGGTEDLVRMWDPRAGVSVGAFGWAARSRISTSARVPRRACGTRALAAARARWTSIRSLSVVGSARFRIGPRRAGNGARSCPVARTGRPANPERGLLREWAPEGCRGLSLNTRLDIHGSVGRRSWLAQSPTGEALAVGSLANGHRCPITTPIGGDLRAPPCEGPTSPGRWGLACRAESAPLQASPAPRLTRERSLVRTQPRPLLEVRS